MSLWIEIHCDKLTEGTSPADILLARCHSHRNDNPGVMVGNTAADMAKAKRYLEREAKDGGWVKIKDGWACPGCKP